VAEDVVATWQVIMAVPIIEKLKRDFKNGLLDKEDIRIIQRWIGEIEKNGLEFMQQNKCWDDHALEQEWFGYRSSCFSKRGRIIYQVEEAKIVVRVVRITPTHDYRK
jgi:mRNA-degrading endonuclease YafQ of YafQ-DinJ toxin-antitoxin module